MDLALIWMEVFGKQVNKWVVSAVAQDEVSRGEELPLLGGGAITPFRFLSCFCRHEKLKVLPVDNLILKSYLADVSIGCSNPPQSEMRRIGAHC